MGADSSPHPSYFLQPEFFTQFTSLELEMKKRRFEKSREHGGKNIGKYQEMTEIQVLSPAKTNSRKRGNKKWE
jgi:hypothetical protein